MVGSVEVKLLQVLGEDDDRITDEEMCEMSGKQIIHATVNQALLKIFVDDQIWVHVFLP